MGLKQAYSYYGRLDGPTPVRDFINELIQDRKLMMQTELREMEERIRRHITEAKKEIIDEIDSIFSDFKDKSTPTKRENKDNGKSKCKRSTK
jgi:hypothetical protein